MRRGGRARGSGGGGGGRGWSSSRTQGRNDARKQPMYQGWELPARNRPSGGSGLRDDSAAVGFPATGGVLPERPSSATINGQTHAVCDTAASSAGTGINLRT